jgi:hypothetical protein
LNNTVTTAAISTAAGSADGDPRSASNGSRANTIRTASPAATWSCVPSSLELPSTSVIIPVRAGATRAARASGGIRPTVATIGNQ